MSRLLAAARSDLRLQLRYGITAAGAFVTLLCVVLLRRLPDAALGRAVPFVLFADLAVLGLFFLPGLVLFESDERTLAALAVTPLRPWEYLAAKVGTLTGLALLLGVVLAVGAGGTVALPPLVAGVGLLSVLSSLVAFLVVAGRGGMLEYVLASQLVTVPLALPLLWLLGWVDSPLLFLLPSHGPLVLLTGGPIGAAAPAVAWIALLWVLALRAHRRHLFGG